MTTFDLGVKWVKVNPVSSFVQTIMGPSTCQVSRKSAHRFQSRFLQGNYHNYMVMAAILVMSPEPFGQTFVYPSKGGSTRNLASISPVVSEDMMFENADR